MARVSVVDLAKLGDQWGKDFADKFSKDWQKSFKKFNFGPDKLKFKFKDKNKDDDNDNDNDNDSGNSDDDNVKTAMPHSTTGRRPKLSASAPWNRFMNAKPNR